MKGRHPRSCERAERASIIESMQPMIELARRDRLLLFSKYQDIMFTPDELDAAHREGRFVWGPVNWYTMTVDEVVERSARDLARKQEQHDKLVERVSGYGQQG